MDDKKKNQTSHQQLAPSKEWSFYPMTLYEYTLNLNDDFQRIGKTLDLRYINAHATVKNIFDKTNIKYCLYPEITMPQYGDKYTNSMPRIHWHGFVYFPTSGDIVQYLLSTAILISKVGRYQFNQARPKYWVKYMTKHKHLFKELKPLKCINLQDIVKIHTHSKEPHQPKEAL